MPRRPLQALSTVIPGTARTLTGALAVVAVVATPVAARDGDDTRRLVMGLAAIAAVGLIAREVQQEREAARDDRREVTRSPAPIPRFVPESRVEPAPETAVAVSLRPMARPPFPPSVAMPAAAVPVAGRLPGACLVVWRTARGPVEVADVEVVDPDCLTARLGAVAAADLPFECATTLVHGERIAAAYDPACLRGEGWRLDG